MEKVKIKPTEGELEILAVLWEKKEATVRDVHEEILKKKDSGYTTTLKLMQIMYEKNLVTKDNSQKTHVYKPCITREQTGEVMVNKLIKNLFGGKPSALVMQALGNKATTREELTKIEQLIRELKAK